MLESQWANETESQALNLESEKENCRKLVKV